MSSLDDKNPNAAILQEDSLTDSSTKEEETFTSAQHSSPFGSFPEILSPLQLPQDTPAVAASSDLELSSSINQSQASNASSVHVPTGLASKDFATTGSTIVSVEFSDQVQETFYCVASSDPSKIPRGVNGKDDETRSTLSWDDEYDPTGIYGHGVDPKIKHDLLLENHSRGLIDQQSSKYELRQSIDRENFRGSGWGDRDESGNYNPNEKLIRVKSKPKRPRPIDVGETLTNGDEDEDGNGNRYKETKPPYKKQKKGAECDKKTPKVRNQWLTLKFETPDGRKRYETMVTGFSNEQTGRDMDDLWVQKFSDDENRKEEDGQMAFSSPVEPGNRYDRATQRNHMPDLTAENVGDFNLEELAMHPSARACIECLQLRVRCSIWDDEDFKFPCESCKEHGMDCHLIDKTIYKKKCERCRMKDQECSYELNGGEDGLPCDSCKDAEVDCLAGPANREEEIPTKKKPTYSDDEAVIDEVSVGKEQSIQKVRVPGKLQKKPKSMSPTLDRGPAEDGSTPEDEFDAENSKEDTTGAPAGPKRVWITTEFYHPIAFNFVPTEKKPCHFCDVPGITYCLTGVEKSTIEVIVSDDPTLGYQEVGSRQDAPDFEPSRMCVRCTSSRIRIIQCPLHFIKQINSKDFSIYDTNKTFEFIHKKDKPYYGQEQLWCSICCRVAFFECCNAPEFDCIGDGAEGCGLLLCTFCSELMTQENSNRVDKFPALDLMWSGCKLEAQIGLDQMINIGEMDGLKYPGCLRADATFLKVDGELYRRLKFRGDEDAQDGNCCQKANEIIEISSDEEVANPRAVKNWKKMLQEKDFS